MFSALVSVVLYLALGPLTRAEDVFFILSHGPLMASRLDSIVNPGGVSSHVHAVIGASNFGPEYDYATQLESECVSGIMSIDKSNYWAPDLYRKDSSGGFKHIGLSYANTYYFMRRQPNEPIHEFPPGFRMMAGSASRTSYDESVKAQKAISYVCLGNGGPQTHNFPEKGCPNGLRAQAFFPNCWDGKNNWLEGSKHVAYPAEGNYDGGGKCPETHPNRIPSLFYEFIYHDTWDAEGGYKTGQRVWAHGDDVGYGFHADFINGWPEGTFKDIASHGDDCNVGFSVENCPVLKPHMQQSGKCEYKGLLVDEDIGATGKKATPIAKLPGNNPVWGSNGPQPEGNYVEDGVFVKVGDDATKITPPGPGRAYAQIDAGDIHIITVRGDTGYTGPTLISGNGATQGVGSGETTQTSVAVSSASSAAVSTASSASNTSSASQRSITSASSSRSSAARASASKSTVGGPVLIASEASSGRVPPNATTSPSPQVSSGKTCKTKRRSRQ